MKIKILPCLFLILLLAACTSASASGSLIETSQPEPPTLGPCDASAVSISIAPTEVDGKWYVTFSGLQPGETITASFDQAVGDDTMTLTIYPLDAADEQGNLTWVEGQLEPGTWEARVKSLAGVTCKIVTVP